MGWYPGGTTATPPTESTYWAGDQACRAGEIQEAPWDWPVSPDQALAQLTLSCKNIRGV